MAELGMPFQGDLWYFVQDDYDTCPTDGDTTYAISCKILDAKVGIADKHEEIRGISSACACDLHELANDYTFHLEFHPQCDSIDFIEHIVDRDANCKLQPLGFSLSTNTCVAAAGDKTCFLICGCKPKTVRISAAFNQYYTITADFSAKTVITDGDALFPATADSSGVGDAPADLVGAYLGFNVGGSIQKDANDVAHILDSFDVTVDHGLKDKWDHDSLTKQYAIEGTLGISGTCDISLDEGGGVHLAEVVNQTEFDLVIDLGGAGCPRLTFTGCKWKTSEIDVNISGDDMMESAPWTCHPDTCAAGFISATPE